MTIQTKPIPFSAPMVQALLREIRTPGTGKTQTRRIIKQASRIDRECNDVVRPFGDGTYFMSAADGTHMNGQFSCPYGKPGDLLIPAMTIPELGDRYCADVQGNIWSRAQGEWKKLKGSPTSRGYLCVTPAVNGKYKTKSVHRMICETFYGAPPAGKPQVRHLDGNQRNNAPDNLDWGSIEDNWSDRAALGSGMGEDHHASKLTREDVSQIRSQKGQVSQRSLAKQYDVSQSQIWCVQNNRTWGDNLSANPVNMPRWASRITLEVADVTPQRLQDISRGDCMSEGCPFPNMAKGPNPRDWFSDLWKSINGPESWDRNDWVWAVTFTPHPTNVDEFIKGRAAA